MAGVTRAVVLSHIDRQKLEGLASSSETPRDILFRSRIVLGLADGETSTSVARKLNVSPATVTRWHYRFKQEGLNGLSQPSSPSNKKRSYPLLALTASDRRQLEEWVSDKETPNHVAVRCHVVLRLAEGHLNISIARQLSVNIGMISRWRRRFNEEGIQALWEPAPASFQKRPERATALSVPEADRLQLQSWASDADTPKEVVRRCRILLAAEQGRPNRAICRLLNVSGLTVRRCRRQYQEEGITSVWKGKPIRKSTRSAFELPDEDRQQLEQWILREDTPSNVKRRSKIVLAIAERRSCREISEQLQVSLNTVLEWRHRFELQASDSLLKFVCRSASNPTALRVSLCDADREQLEQWIEAIGTPQRVKLGSMVILAATRGQRNGSIARELEVKPSTVQRLLQRFQRGGLNCLWETFHAQGRKPLYGPEKIRAIVEARDRAGEGNRARPSGPEVAAQQGVSNSTVYRAWSRHSFRTQVERLTLSRKVELLRGVTDVVGLYLNPPVQVIVFCIAEGHSMLMEDSDRQNLRPNHGKTLTLRVGAGTFLESLEMLQKFVVGQHYERSRQEEFWRFLKFLDMEFPPEITLHMVRDKFGAHEQLKIEERLKKHPRVESHFVPVDSIWLEEVQRWVSELAGDYSWPGRLCSAPDLKRTITEFLTLWSGKPQPFRWVAKVRHIVEKLRGYSAVSEESSL